MSLFDIPTSTPSRSRRSVLGTAAGVAAASSLLGMPESIAEPNGSGLIPSDAPTPHPDLPPGVLYVPAGTGPTVWLAGGTYTFKAFGRETGGRLGFIEASVPPAAGPQPHVHDHENESFYLVSGSLELLINDRTFTANVGDFISIPPGITHRFKNRGLQTAHLLFFFTPGGYEEDLRRRGTPAVPGQPVPPPLD